MDYSDLMGSEFSKYASGGLLGGMMGGFSGVALATMVTIIAIMVVALYIYTSLAWMVIGKKVRYDKPWLAWIPFANISMILQMGGFHWAWVFLLLIPILGWIALIVLMIISMWRIYEKRNYPGWFSLAMIVPKLGGILHLVVLGFVAWKDLKKKLF